MEPLKWLTGSVLAIITAHVAMNLGDYSGVYSTGIALLDIATLAVLAPALMLQIRGKVPASRAQLFGIFVYLVTVVNVIVSEVLRRRSIDIIYLPFVLIAAGTVLLSPAWLAATLSFSIALAIPTVLMVSPKPQVPTILTMMFAGFVISISVFTSRIRSHRRILALR